jgi:hypothetical protein
VGALYPATVQQPGLGMLVEGAPSDPSIATPSDVAQHQVAPQRHMPFLRMDVSISIMFHSIFETDLVP